MGMARFDGNYGSLDVQKWESVEYAEHDGKTLACDIYRPVGSTVVPAFILLHGGGMQSGSRVAYDHWGNFFASNGFAAVTVDYRLSEPNWKAFPSNVFDVKSSIQFVRGTATRWSIDGDRLAVMGGSAGAYLAAMAVVTGRESSFNSPYRDDEYADLSSKVDVGIPMCGAYDMIQQWEHDQLHRPSDHIKEKYLGGNPMDSRKTYYDASPLFHASSKNLANTSWLIAWGTHDDVIDPIRQSVVFAEHAKRAGALVRCVPLVGATHFWYGESDLDVVGSVNSMFVPRLMGFIRRWLKW